MNAKPLLFLLAACLFATTGGVLADSPPAASPAWTESENWIVAQVQAGEAADLTEQYPSDEGKRTIHAHFLEALLNGSLHVVPSHRWGIRILGAVIDGPVDLSNENVSSKVQLDRCRFTRTVNFSRTDFAGTVSFNDTKFLADVSFAVAKAANNALFRRAVFTGQADFGGMNVGGYFVTDAARFRNTEKTANFLGMTVGSSASFEDAIFAGPANFGNLAVGGVFSADGAQFRNRDKTIVLVGLKGKASGLLTGAVFAGGAVFDYASFAETFMINTAQFQNPDQTVSFVNLKVGGNTSLYQTTFAGPVSFASADIGANLIANGTSFLGPGKTVDFIAMKVGNIGSFVDTIFAGPTNFGDSALSSLTVFSTQPGSSRIPQLGLAGAAIKRDLNLQHLRCQDLFASSLRVEGQANLRDLHVARNADLSYSDFANLDLTGSQWPGPRIGKLLLRGTKYKNIRAAADETESHENLLRLADQADYTADIYGNLEGFFVRQGYKDDADQVFVASKNRERRENMSWHSFALYWSWLLRGIGYGRYPERAIIACILVIALGYFLFQPRKMEFRLDRTPTPRFNRFWYSLELFLPLVELKEIDAWEPKDTHPYLQHYMRIHVLLGWILVPICLAAQAGLIK